MTVIVFATDVDDTVTTVRRIALERGFNRAFTDYAAATARTHLRPNPSRWPNPNDLPLVTGALDALRRRHREQPADYQARARHNPIAAVVLDGIHEHALASRR